MGFGGSRITPEVVQSVRDAIDIVEIGNEVTTLKRRGNRYLGLCPFHKEKTPSFSVDAQQGLFYCFGCGVGGDAIKLYQQNTGDDFPAAIESLARRYGIPLPTATGPQREDPSRKLGDVLEAASTFFRQQLVRSPAAQKYLEDRKMPKELQERYALGYAPDEWRRLLETLGNRYPLDSLIDAGLVGRSQRTGDPYDRFRHRLMFPIHTASGRLVGFGGRTLGDDRAKYVNTSETEQFHKGRLLYGFHQAKRALRDGGKALLVEGYFDVLGAAACELPFSVAGMGTSLTADQARLLSRYTDEVLVAYDGDEAGEKAFQRALPILLGAGLSVRRVRFPDGHDPDSLRLEKGPEVVQELVESAQDGVELEIDRLTPASILRDPHAKTRAANAVVEILGPIRDGIVRHAYGQLAAQRLGVPTELLWRRRGQVQKAPSSDERPAAGKQSEVRTDEEKALYFLFQPNAPVPSLEELPPREVFFDSECRNIYSVFCALVEGGESRAPTSSEVMARMDPEAGGIDRMARLLLEEPDSVGGDLQGALDSLLHRWRKQRQPELVRRIRQAELEGDTEGLAQLLEEKKLLSRSLHPRMTGKLW